MDEFKSVNVTTFLQNLQDNDVRLSISYWNYSLQLKLIPKASENDSGMSVYTQDFDKIRVFSLSKEQAWQILNLFNGKVKGPIEFTSRNGNLTFKLTSNKGSYTMELGKTDALSLSMTLDDGSYNFDMLSRYLNVFVSPENTTRHYTLLKSKNGKQDTPEGGFGEFGDRIPF